MKTFSDYINHLKKNQYSWLITGAGGFIGSNLVNFLLGLNQRVVGLDNFSLGIKEELLNLTKNYENNLFTLVEGDINDKKTCILALKKVDFALHHAALGSVPRSISDPFSSNEANISGFLNMLISARDSNVKNFIYASSSSAYGDHEALPKVEDVIGKPKNPYSITKYVNELYANTFEEHYGFKSIGLRYFNVFGARAPSNGQYAPVTGIFMRQFKQNQPLTIVGDGSSLRDFVHVDDVVKANIIFINQKQKNEFNDTFNVGSGENISVKSIADMISNNQTFVPPRQGEAKITLANIEKIKNITGWMPSTSITKWISDNI